MIDTQEGDEPAIAEIASAAGIPERMLHVRGALAAADRAAVFGAALAFVAPSRRAAFPWRVVDALTLGVPIIAADSAVHAEVIVDGGSLVEGADAASLVDGLADASNARWRRLPRPTGWPCWRATAGVRSRGARPPSGCGSCTRSCRRPTCDARVANKSWSSSVTSATLFT